MGVTMSALIFIDTNIMLDFYRIRSEGYGLSVLKHINDNHLKIITGNQIEMEFKKNRQEVILESLERIKTPDWSCLSTPAFFTQTRPVKSIKKSKNELITHYKILKDRIEIILKDPVRNDPVFQTLQRLFKNKSEFNLDRSKKIRYRIRSLAWKRFLLGYPPRKKKDTSMGDSVNWEWIIYCAQQSDKNIVIVSRDTDYGVTYNNESLLNDALSQEFKERLSHKRKIFLTDKLTHAFKLASIQITKKDEKEEIKLINDISKQITTNENLQKRALEIALEQIDNTYYKHLKEYVERADKKKDIDKFT
jgi:hypothetical protein